MTKYPGYPGRFNEPGTSLIPGVPYDCCLDTLCDGFMITVTGHVLPDADRFHINLSLDKEDHAIHVNPRFPQKQVVRNSKLDGRWGKEEREASDFPLDVDQDFKAVILVTDDCYKVAFNGAHYCDYDHRVDKEKVSHLMVHGDVVLSQIQISNPQKTLEVPFETKLPNGMEPGTAVKIRGKPKEGASRFHVNFVTKDGDIAFHFNPRFGGDVVVSNTKTDGSWGKEEREDKFPFKEGQEFTAIIFSDSKKFRVILNGQNFVRYKHRLTDLASITQVDVVGDLDLYSVEAYP